MKPLVGDRSHQNRHIKEIERCHLAIELAQEGQNVAMVCSGDAGIYGMAKLILEIVTKEKRDIQVRVVPVLPPVSPPRLYCAPLMHDFAISA